MIFQSFLIIFIYKLINLDLLLFCDIILLTKIIFKQMENCIFCKIANKEIETNILYENNNIIAFPDINPIAPVHVLIIPKKHIASINDLDNYDQKIISDIILAAKKISKDLDISEDGYKLLFRVGKNGGQEIPHIHLHLIGGAKLHEDIRPI